MRKLAIAMLGMASGMAQAADPWFSESPLGMHQLVEQGFQLVGFSVTAEESRIYSGVVAMRYVLQKVGPGGVAEIAQCTQKMVGGDVVSSTCFALRRP